MHNWFGPMRTLAIYEFTREKIVFVNPGKYYLPLWKNETTPLKLHAQLTYKQNEKQYYKHTL